MSKPVSLTDAARQQYARRLRDRQWWFMERMARVGTLWYCPWNKCRRPAAPDEVRDSLLSAISLLDWIDQHPAWFLEGPWDETRDAFPLQLTEAGRAALQQRERYDWEPVRGGLVAPGWEVRPAGLVDPAGSSY
jgi:hypothetical protein